MSRSDLLRGKGRVSLTAPLPIPHGTFPTPQGPPATYPRAAVLIPSEMAAPTPPSPEALDEAEAALAGAFGRAPSQVAPIPSLSGGMWAVGGWFLFPGDASLTVILDPKLPYAPQAARAASMVAERIVLPPPP